MGKIYYILGKSSTGKDTIYNKIMEEGGLNLKKILMYTTRPIREGEEQGKDYFFVTEDEYYHLKENGYLIEMRSYQTIHGIWRYFTVNDTQIDLCKNSYMMIGVLTSYLSTKDYFGEDKVVPIYIELDDGVRLQRALDREKMQGEPKYAELCRRYLSDSADFAEEKIEKAGITKRFLNNDLETCVREVREYILKKERAVESCGYQSK
ncbi:guanylate kinase [bacterium C-53]|nr:guanylate kinase [Lachnospiraceae bacterium]NBI04494.1 guanylate kinase [Lachnospiraceae bacterium]RKJ08177.1 guanylate kinase [bacterium C-53]